MASYLHRTAQPFTLATFRSWGSSTGAGRIRLAAANIRLFSETGTVKIKLLCRPQKLNPGLSVRELILLTPISWSQRSVKDL